MFEARVIAGKILKTNAAYRPNPSLLYFPGLNTKPFYDIKDFEFWKLLQDNFKDTHPMCQSLFLKIIV